MSSTSWRILGAILIVATVGFLSCTTLFDNPKSGSPTPMDEPAIHAV